MSERRNMARCVECGDTIESKSRHDFRTCRCGKLSVDGGPVYLRRCYSGSWEELSTGFTKEEGGRDSR